MKIALLIALPLFAASCLADSLPPAGEHAMPEPAASPAQAESFMYNGSYRSTEMDRILLFVCDKDSADAAAKRVQALLNLRDSSLPPVKDDILHELHYGCDYFGSAALRELLARYVPAPSEELQRFMERTTSLKTRFHEAELKLAEQIAAVHDTESEAQALAAMKDFVATTESASADSCFSAATFDNDEDFLCAIAFTNRPPLLFVPILHAYAQAQAGEGGPYPALADGLRRLLRNIIREENWDEDAAAFVEYQVAHAAHPEDCKKRKLMVHEWLTCLAGVKDKDSADAAAKRGREMEATLGCRIQQLGNCVCIDKFPLLHYRAVFYELGGAVKPAFYGSEKLEALLTPDPTEPERETP